MRPIAFITDIHYPMIDEWFKARKYKPVPKELLPPTGVVMESDSGPLCAGFLAKTDYGVALIGHLVTNPNADKISRRMALDRVITELSDRAIKEGFKMVGAATNNKSLMKKYVALGWNVSDENVTGFWRS